MIPKGISHARKAIPSILEDAENVLSALFRELLSELYDELVHLEKRIHALEQKLVALSAGHDDCQFLLAIPGVGLLTATALVAAIGDISVFKNGRELAAWLGLVPKRHSTGGKQTLLGISKRGGSYLRTMLILGARAVLKVSDNKKDPRSPWIQNLCSRRNKNIAAVTLAYKNARIV